jgi:hypothetical protein
VNAIKWGCSGPLAHECDQVGVLMATGMRAMWASVSKLPRVSAQSGTGLRVSLGLERMLLVRD